MARTKEYAQRLYNAETEEEVIEIVAEIVDEYDVEWVPLGGTENNSGMVDIQKGTPVGALAEIVVNGFDAILQKRYVDQYGDEYDDEHDLNTYLDAAEHLIDDGDEELVEIIADGQMPTEGGEVNLTVADTGKGQRREDFSNFVDVMEVGLNKQDWPFAQGQFGMGSHAIQRHCGDNELDGAGFKLIASAHYDSPGEWTWTLIRRNPEQDTTFEYLTIGGDFPTFDGALSLPKEDGEKEYGTAIKHFNFQMPQKSEITKPAALRGELDLELLENPVPIRLTETRYNRESVSGVMNTETLGAYRRLKEADEVKYHVEERLTSKRLPEFLQGTEVDIFLFHDDDTIEERDDLSNRTKNNLKGGSHHQDNSIIFAANGERHASKTHYHLRQKCDLYNTATDVKVIVDLSDVSWVDLRKVFDPSRDGLHDNSEPADVLEERVIEAIRENEALREEEANRRTATAEDTFEEDIRDTLESMLDRNPQLADLLNAGTMVANTNESGDDEPYTRTQPPTELRAISTYRPNGENDLWGEADDEDADEPYGVEMPANRHKWQRFELDAPNGYFDDERGEHDGELEIEPSFVAEEMVEGWGLNNGILAIELAPHEGATAGMEAPFTVTVTRDDGEQLSEDIRVTFTEAVEESEGDQRDTPETETDSEALQLPDIQWKEMGDEGSVVEVQDREERMTVFVNEDAESLESFLRDKNWKQKGQKVVREEFKLGVGVYTFGQYHRLKESYDDEIEAAKAAQEAAKGLAPMFLAYHFDEEEVDRLTL